MNEKEAHISKWDGVLKSNSPVCSATYQHCWRGGTISVSFFGGGRYYILPLPHLGDCWEEEASMDVSSAFEVLMLMFEFRERWTPAPPSLPFPPLSVVFSHTPSERPRKQRSKTQRMELESSTLSFWKWREISCEATLHHYKHCIQCDPSQNIFSMREGRNSRYEHRQLDQRIPKGTGMERSK